MTEKDKERKEWEKNLFDSYKESDSFHTDIKTLIEIVIYENFGERLGRLYNIIDSNHLFSKIIDEFSENQITFPSKDEFKDAVMTALVYYYHNILCYDWKEIENAMPYEHDIGLRYHRKIEKISENLTKKLKKFSKKRIEIEDDIFNL